MRLESGCSHFLCRLVFLLALPAVPTFCQAPDPFDCERMLQRMQKSAALTEAEVIALRPIVSDRITFVQRLLTGYREGEGAGIEALQKKLEVSDREFRSAVSRQLDSGRLVSVNKFLDEWNSECIQAAAAKKQQPSAGQPAEGRKISLSVTPLKFEEAPGEPMVQLSKMKTDKSSSASGKDATAKRGEIAVAPYPSVSPTIGNGIVFVGAYMRRLNAKDKISPPSVFGLGGMYTSSNSWAAGYGQKLFLKRDRFRISGGFGFARLNYDFSIGEIAGEEIRIPIHQKGYGFLAGGQVRTYKRWYLGMKYHYLTAKTGVDLNEILSGLPIDIEPYTLDIHLAGLAALIERDTRDSQFYPKHGSVFELQGDFNEKTLGGDYNFQQYLISNQGYFSLGKRHVLAYSASACAIKGHPPFFSLCMLGKTSDLRGYAMGKHQNRRMLVGQAEYRLELPWRFGFAAFMGAGEVAPTWGDFNTDNIYPGGGLGLRFLLAKMNHVNLRIDYAWGKGSKAWYVGLGEAF